MALSRRDLLIRSGAVGAGIGLTGSVGALFGTKAAYATPSGEAYGYGPLVPDPARVLDLPEGFSYRTFSKYRTPATGGLVPTRHDGMATFPGADASRVRLVRNHECHIDSVRVPAAPEFTFDRAAGAKGQLVPGGTMTVELDDDLDVLSEYGSLGGTVRNCAGGRTPWGTWLSCEETEVRAGMRIHDGVFQHDHGWVFEVDPANPSNNVDPMPLTGMGRYAHEAVAVDPATSVAYLTEDAGAPYGLLYRFTPADAGGGYGSYRAGGLLEAMRLPDVRDLSEVRDVNTRFNDVDWVPVPDPLAVTVPTRMQLVDEEVTRAEKLEGAWYGDGHVFIVSSFASNDRAEGHPHDGQVWRYDPKANALTLELIFNGGSCTRFGRPDNITVSPFGGGVILAEDGLGDQYLVGVAQNGLPFPIARNALNTAELAGVTFSPDNRTLFGNIFGGTGGGLSFAIRGPWAAVSPANPRSA
ncbi:MAG TPA: alkaline phosphatase PhoX [Mycobacteriales bacterium]|nr:alkaline phosphatase PhoX [Mycobacteriales bacterium]